MTIVLATIAGARSFERVAPNLLSNQAWIAYDRRVMHYR